MNCPVQVAADSEVDRVSQNARPSEEPAVPQRRPCGEMLEETCRQEDGGEDMHGRGCSMPKGCMPESLQPMDNPHQGRDALNDCGHG